MTVTAAQAQDRPITNREPDAVDVAKTPVTDLNLSKSEIPALLIEAQRAPYSLQGLGKCSQLVAAVEEFDRVLGPDLDLPQAERDRFSEGRIAQWVVGSFIPFRGLIREISGANKNERELAAAIQAGLARRGFLKGVGAARGCRWPAAPANAAVIAEHRARMDAQTEKADAKDAKNEDKKEKEKEKDADKRRSDKSKSKVIYTSEPVVQRTR